MSKSRSISRNSSLVSIRYAPLSKGQPNANEREEAPTPVIDIAALRNIRRIVETLRNRIDAGDGNTTGDGAQRYPPGDPGGPTNISSDRIKDINRQKEENR